MNKYFFTTIVMLSLICSLGISQDKVKTKERVNAREQAKFQKDKNLDLDVDVDVLVEPKENKLKGAFGNQNVLEMVKEKLDLKTKLSNQEKEKIMSKLSLAVKSAEIAPIQLAIRLSEQIEARVRNTSRINADEMANSLSEEVKKLDMAFKSAKSEVDNEVKALLKEIKNKYEKQNLQKAAIVLESLVEKGIPVEHALSAVRNAFTKREELRKRDIQNVSEEYIKNKIDQNELQLNELVREQVRNEFNRRYQNKESAGSAQTGQQNTNEFRYQKRQTDTSQEQTRQQNMTQEQLQQMERLKKQGK